MDAFTNALTQLQAERGDRAVAPQEGQLTNVTARIVANKRVAGAAFLEIGRLLIEAKKLVPHGEWGTYLREQVDFSARSAQQFMQVAREYAANPQLAADLGFRKAIAFLDVPAEERQTVADEIHAEDLSARQLEEALAARRQAEEALKVSSESLSVANASLEGANQQIADLRREVTELQNRPIEVAVQTVPDEAAVKAAAKEAREKAEAKAAAKLAKQAETIAALEAEVRQAKAQGGTDRAEQAEAEAQRLRQELAIARNEDVYAVQLCFEQIKELSNRMQGHILRLQARGQMQEYEKCRKAQRMLGEAIVSASGAQ